MAVQTKTNSGNTPKKKERNWTQIGIVAFCVLIAVMCVLSFSGVITNIIGGNGNGGASSIVAQPGYPVQVNATLYADDKQVLTGSIAFIAGTESNTSVYLQFEEYDEPFVIYAEEFNQISNGVIGLKPGESRTVAGYPIELEYTKQEFDSGNMGIAFDDVEKGSMLSLGVPYTNDEGESALAMRFGVVTDKTDDKLVIQSGSDRIDILFQGYVQLAPQSTTE